MKKILIFIVCLILCGCYNYNELEDLDIVSSIVVDYQNEEYFIKLEVVDEDKTKVYDGHGKSLSEAFESITLVSPNEIFLSHLNTVMFTKDVDLLKLTNYFLREPKVNTTFYFILTEISDVYSDTNLGEDIYKILDNHHVYNFFHLARIINDNNKDIIIPYLNKDKKIESGFIFSNNLPVSEVSYENVEIYKILDNINNANLMIDDIDIELTNVTTNISFNNEFHIDVISNVTVLQNDSEYNLGSEKDIKELEDKINENIKNKIINLINILIKYDSDIFGFQDKLNSKKHNDLLNKKKQKFKVNVNASISKKGLLKS